MQLKCLSTTLIYLSLTLSFDSLACTESDESPKALSTFESDAEKNLLFPKGKESVVISTRQIHIEGYPEAYNPSIIQTDRGILMLFRSLPTPNGKAFISDTGAVWLNDAFEPISKPQLLITRQKGDPTPQQSEDVRVFLWKDELYLVYNDNVEITNASEWDRRDIFIAKLTYENGIFSVGPPLKLTHSEQYSKVLWQKNWQPFDWQGQLFLGYTINPHEVITPDLTTGICYPIYKTRGEIHWHWGSLRGGAPAQRVEDHYLSFFHSPLRFVSETTDGRDLMHYFIGAYLYSGEPPFELTHISPYPIATDGFYTPSPLGIRCVYPGGFAIKGEYIYLAYGKEDNQVWIAVIDKKKLYESLVPIREVE